jgi:hypothetical protein
MKKLITLLIILSFSVENTAIGYAQRVVSYATLRPVAAHLTSLGVKTKLSSIGEKKYTAQPRQILVDLDEQALKAVINSAQKVIEVNFGKGKKFVISELVFSDTNHENELRRMFALPNKLNWPNLTEESLYVVLLVDKNTSPEKATPLALARFQYLEYGTMWVHNQGVGILFQFKPVLSAAETKALTALGKAFEQEKPYQQMWKKDTFPAFLKEKPLRTGSFRCESVDLNTIRNSAHAQETVRVEMGEMTEGQIPVKIFYTPTTNPYEKDPLPKSSSSGREIKNRDEENDELSDDAPIGRYSNEEGGIRPVVPKKKFQAEIYPAERFKFWRKIHSILTQGISPESLALSEAAAAFGIFTPEIAAEAIKSMTTAPEHQSRILNAVVALDWESLAAQEDAIDPGKFYSIRCSADEELFPSNAIPLTERYLLTTAHNIYDVNKEVELMDHLRPFGNIIGRGRVVALLKGEKPDVAVIEITEISESDRARYLAPRQFALPDNTKIGFFVPWTGITQAGTMQPVKKGHLRYVLIGSKIANGFCGSPVFQKSQEGSFKITAMITGGVCGTAHSIEGILNKIINACSSHGKEKEDAYIREENKDNLKQAAIILQEGLKEIEVPAKSEDTKLDSVDKAQVTIVAPGSKAPKTSSSGEDRVAISNQCGWIAQIACSEGGLLQTYFDKEHGEYLSLDDLQKMETLLKDALEMYWEDFISEIKKIGFIDFEAFFKLLIQNSLSSSDLSLLAGAAQTLETIMARFLDEKQKELSTPGARGKGTHMVDGMIEQMQGPVARSSAIPVTTTSIATPIRKPTPVFMAAIESAA